MITNKEWQTLFPTILPDEVPFKAELVYVLQLEDGKYYVGHTIHLFERMKRHWEGTGALWTALHPPVKVLVLIGGSVRTETKITIHCREHWGKDNVRGGPFCHVWYPKYRSLAPSSAYRWVPEDEW